MTHYLEEIVFEFEKYMISPDEISPQDSLPEEISKYIELFLEAEKSGNFFDSEYMREYGGSTGIAKHPIYGWALLACGQGPFIVWSERRF